VSSVLSKYLADPNWWLAILTLLGLIVAIVTLRNQTKSFKLTIGADLAMKLDERFNDPEFLDIRRTAAQALRAGSVLKQAEDVFDFFDTVGLFVRLKALDPEIAHSLFFHWANLYWCTGEKYIKAQRRMTKLRWNDFETLYRAICVIEKAHDASSGDLHLTPELIDEYLRDEP
jgi:hypothetical protein